MAVGFWAGGCRFCGLGSRVGGGGVDCGEGYLEEALELVRQALDVVGGAPMAPEGRAGRRA
jgi:hypothetical protein